MCKQCPTVGDFVSWVFGCNRCCNACKETEHRCQCNKCARKEKRYECFCQEKKEPTPCFKEEEKEHGRGDCDCKFY